MTNPNQLLINRLVPRLLAQGKKSHNNGNCFYRAADGSKCVIGHGIDDAHYSLDLEGHAASDADVIEVVCASNADIGITPETFDGNFWEEAQLAHDDAETDLSDFLELFCITLKRHGYTYEAEQ